MSEKIEKPKAEARKPETDWMAPGSPRAVSVASLRFRTGTTVDLPSAAGKSGITDERFERDPLTRVWRRKATEQTNTHRYRITYLPWLGMFAVVHHAPSELAPSGPPTMIPREWASWEPAPADETI